MGPADIAFQLFTTLIGVAAGATASLYFFRAQQKTDFSKLLEQMNNLTAKQTVDAEKNERGTNEVLRRISSVDQTFQHVSRDTAIIKTATDTKSVAAIYKSLDGLRHSHSKLATEVTSLSDRIIRSLSAQQDSFLQRIQTEFVKSVDTSKSTLKHTLAKELAPFIPASKDHAAAVQKLIELVGYAMTTMGKYQLEAVQTQSRKALDEAGQQVAASIGEVQADVTQVKKKLDELPLALPQPQPR